MTLDWQNGLPFSSRFGDVYFSADSGLEETRHVFLQGNRLTERFSALSSGESFAIGETGFGTALNFLCAWQLFIQVAQPRVTLDFFSIEKYPLDDSELNRALALWPELQPQTKALLKKWHRRVPGWNRWSFEGGRVRLTLAIGDVTETLPELPNGAVDAWFLDGFSPAKNPEMWSDEVLSGIARTSRHGATLATYTSAGWVRRGLQQAGFSVESVPGFGRKREMMRGGISSLSLKIDRSSTPKTALVIGGGVAGCSAAHALAERGVAVTLIECAERLASGASGNSRGILHARFGAGSAPLHRFVLAAYGHALGLLDEVLPVDGILRDECGLLQLDFSPNESKRMARLAEREWPEQLLRFVDAGMATELTGMQMVYGGVWFPGGGWVVPPLLCERFAANTRIDIRLSEIVNSLTRSDAGWSVTGKDSLGRTWSIQAERVVVCCAHSALALEPFARFPMTPVRGQVTVLPATIGSQSLRAVVCGDRYCAPALEGVHLSGATYAFNDESLELRASDHIDNLAKLAVHAPALREALGEIDIEKLGGRAGIRCSAPGAMPLVGQVQTDLYCSLAHGTRGLLTAGISGEMIAALACGQLSPLPTSVQRALNGWKS